MGLDLNRFTADAKACIATLSVEQVAVAREIAETPRDVLFSCRANNCPSVELRRKAESAGLLQFTYVQDDGRSCDAPDIAQNMQQVYLYHEHLMALTSGNAVPKSVSLEQFVRSHGFVDTAEFQRMIGDADTSTPERLQAFLEWQDYDSTKEGLMKLPSKIKDR